MELILAIVFIGVMYIMCHITDWKFNNYTLPNGYKVDHSKLALDRARNNLSNEEVMKNTIAGKYNVRR